jgi:hypothetical protein
VGWATGIRTLARVAIFAFATGFGCHPSSYWMSIDGYIIVVKASTHIHLLPRLRIYGVLPLFRHTSSLKILNVEKLSLRIFAAFYFIAWGGVWWDWAKFVHMPLAGPLCQPRITDEHRKVGGTRIGRRSEILAEKLQQGHFVHCKSHTTWPRSYLLLTLSLK